MSSIEVEQLIMHLRAQQAYTDDGRIAPEFSEDLKWNLGLAELVVVRDREEPENLWIRHQGSTSYATAFTSAAMLKMPTVLESLGQAVPYGMWRGHQLAEFWTDGLHLALNPGVDGLDVWLDSKAVFDLSQVAQFDQGTELVLRSPEVEPDTEVVTAIAETLRDFPEYDAGYLFEVSSPDQEPMLMLGLALRSDLADDEEITSTELLSTHDPSGFVRKLGRLKVAQGLALSVLEGEMLVSAQQCGIEIRS